ncbi:MAG: hypothetical protein P4M15_02145 [Alphaproteobacteria bacterium]|nr:hypothetical protein [Alphaproteobacteria bacterium]
MLKRIMHVSEEIFLHLSGKKLQEYVSEADGASHWVERFAGGACQVTYHSPYAVQHIPDEPKLSWSTLKKAARLAG